MRLTIPLVLILWETSALLSACSTRMVIDPSRTEMPAYKYGSEANPENTGGVALISMRSLSVGRLTPSGNDVRPTGVAISDITANAGHVDILNGHYHTVKRIASGINGPDGAWYDSNGHLYVANSKGADVQEYGTPPSAPTFTYSTNLNEPVDVTTDIQGNVYVADFGSGSVVEYAQGSNAPLMQCNPNAGGVEGVAVDSSGNVFLTAFLLPSGPGSLLEYKGGLKGCSATSLAGSGVGRPFFGGLRIDRRGTLAVCDQQNNVVFLIPKPYDFKKRPYQQLFTNSNTFRDAFDKAQNIIFVVTLSGSGGDVELFTYPSGRYLMTLPNRKDMRSPLGVAAE